MLEYNSKIILVFCFEKILNPRDNNEIKPPLGKILKKHKPIIHCFVMF